MNYLCLTKELAMLTIASEHYVCGKNQVTVLRLDGDLQWEGEGEETSLSAFRKEVAETESNVILDLEGIKSVDSSTVGVLAAAHTTVVTNRRASLVSGLSKPKCWSK